MIDSEIIEIACQESTIFERLKEFTNFETTDLRSFLQSVLERGLYKAQAP